MIDKNYNKAVVIAEIGCNHKGNLQIAKELIDLAYKAGANIAKFQKRNNKELLTKDQYNSPHPNQSNSYGKTYGEHREALEFTAEQHYELSQYAKQVGIEYSTSVWDVSSAKEIIDINPSFIKIPSACNNNFNLLRVLRDDYQGDVHLSVGMTYKHEIESIINFFEETKQAKDRLVVYSCTSGYPVDFKEICLLEIDNLRDQYAHRVKELGFSGHHLGIAIDIAAYTLGAVYIERHFTKDRTWKGTDHSASLEYHGLEKLCRDLANTYLALQYKKDEILDIEQVQRDKLKFKNQL